MKKFFVSLLFLFLLSPFARAKQVLPSVIIDNTIIITTSKTGELGKNYFYCTSGNKCSTEQVVREYYANAGYKVMRAEYSFWQGMFVLVFLDEYYPHTLNRKDYWFQDYRLKDVPEEELKTKCKLIKKVNLQDFLNGQIVKHESGSYIRWLDEWEFEEYPNALEYFKSPLVQEFLARVNRKTFYKVITNILNSEGQNPLGTPDYIVWNDKEMIFIEVKRKNEKLSPEQIQWGEFLIKNKILYKVVRVEKISKSK